MKHKTIRPLASLMLAVALAAALSLVLSSPAEAQSDDERAFQFAERLYRDGLYELAYEQFETFVSEHPRSNQVPQAMLLAADSLIQLERLDEAMAVYDRAAERFRKTPLGCEASYRRSAILAEQERHGEALREFDALKGAYPDCARRYEAELGAAEALIALARPDEALARIADLPADPDRPGMLARTAFDRALALQTAGETGNALAAYEAVMQLFPTTVWEDKSRVGRATILAGEGYHGEAIAELRAVGDHGHEDSAALRSEALALSGDILEALGRLRESGEAYRDAAHLIDDAGERQALELRAATVFRRGSEPAEALSTLADMADPTADPQLGLRAAFMRAEIAAGVERSSEAQAALELLAARAAVDTLDAGTRALADSLTFEAVLLSAALEVTAGDASAASHILRTWPRDDAPAEQRARVDARLGTIELDELERPLEARAALSSAVAAWKKTDEVVPAHLFLALGRAEERLEHWTDARAAYHAAYADRPRHELTDEAQSREAYVRDYLEVDTAGAAEALVGLAEDAARGRVEGAAALLALADIHYEKLKDYDASARLYGEYVDAAGDTQSFEVADALYRAGRASILSAHRPGKDPDGGRVRAGNAYLARLAEEYPEHGRADDAQLALIESRFESSQGGATEEAQAYQEMLERFPKSEHRHTVLYRLGDIYRTAGQAAGDDSTSYAVARDYYAAVVRDHAASDVAPEAAYWRAVLAERLGETVAAQGAYQDCLRLYPRGTWATEAHFQLGEIALGDERLRDAREHYGWIVAENPEHELGLQARARLGDCDLIERRFEDARDHYRAMLEADPKGPLADEAVFRIAESYERQGQAGEAEATLRRFLASYPDSELRPVVQRRLGDLRMARGDYLGAADAYERFVESGPEPAAARDARFRRAEALRSGDRGKDALDIYKSLAKASADDSLAVLDQERARAEEVLLLYDLDKEKDARKKTERFAKDYPDSADWLLEMEIARGNYLLRKDPAQAAEHFDNLLAAHAGAPESERILYGRGLVALGSRDFETSTRFFEELLRQFPGSSLAQDAHFKLGTSYYSLERYNDAAREYRRAYELAPAAAQSGDALHNLGLCLERAERFDDAIRVYRQMERDYADTPRGLRAAFKVGFVYQEWGKLDQAISTYKKVLPRQTGVDAAETQFWIAECYESKGELEKAAGEYLKVGYLYPDSGMWAGTSRYRAGEVYEKLGRMDDAESVYSALADDDSGEWGGRAAEKLRLMSNDGN